MSSVDGYIPLLPPPPTITTTTKATDATPRLTLTLQLLVTGMYR
jgi:hypothetical protein